MALHLIDADVIDDLVTGGAADVLSAEQGVVIKALIDNLVLDSLGDVDTTTTVPQNGDFFRNDGTNYVPYRPEFYYGTINSTQLINNGTSATIPTTITMGSMGNVVTGTVSGTTAAGGYTAASSFLAKITMFITYEGNSNRYNPSLQITLNGTGTGPISRMGYCRNSGVNDHSSTLITLITNVSAGQVISANVLSDGTLSGNAVNLLANDSYFMVETVMA